MNRNPYLKIQPKTKDPYTIIYLIRHANPDYRLESKLGDALMPLSPEGRNQADCLARHMLDFSVDIIYSSALARAQQTAAVLANSLKLSILVDNRLNELDWKNWRRVKYFRTSEERRRQELPGYKDLDRELDKAQSEARRFLEDIYKKHKGKRVALFCHGNIIKAILTGVMNADVIGFLSLEIYQASVTKLLIDSNGYVKIGSINNVSHLPNPPQEDKFITFLD